MNAAVILALLSDLYTQVVDLAKENTELRAMLADRSEPKD